MTPRITPAQWESFLARHPQTHILQSTAWGELKTGFGWDVERIHIGESGAQILFRKFPLGLSLAYIPKGPVGSWLPELLPTLDEFCHKRRSFALKIEPDDHENPEIAASLLNHGFTPSSHTIQPRRTFILDLHGDDESLLARMHQKTRYNVRLALRKGVTVRPWDDLDTFGHMIQETAIRDSFGAHTPSYYRRAYGLFYPLGACELLVAEYGGTPLSAVMVFSHGSRAWYFYGASTSLERNRMPTYLLQWEAIKWAQRQGCSTYDLWGVPDEDLNRLEEEFPTREGGLWGVYRFKRGFGGKLVRSAGAWDRAYNRTLYQLYRLLFSFLRK